METTLDIVGMSLHKLHFELYPEDYDVETNLNLEIVMECEQNQSKLGEISWKFSLIFAPLFKLEAYYEMYFRFDGELRISKEEIFEQTNYPILAQFSTLVSSLTKEAGATPLVMTPAELIELADLDMD